MHTYLEWYDFVTWEACESKLYKRPYFPREIANIAYQYLLEFQLSAATGKATKTIDRILTELFETDAPEATAWFTEISSSIKRTGLV